MKHYFAHTDDYGNIQRMCKRCRTVNAATASYCSLCRVPFNGQDPDNVPKVTDRGIRLRVSGFPLKTKESRVEVKQA